jgi:hypothetical protein
MFRVVEILLSSISFFVSGVHLPKRDVPARLIIQSCPFTDSCHAPSSTGSPITIDVPPGSLSDAFSDRLSTVTVCPSPANLETRLLPTKPVPPVMKIFINCPFFYLHIMFEIRANEPLGIINAMGNPLRKRSDMVMADG